MAYVCHMKVYSGYTYSLPSQIYYNVLITICLQYEVHIIIIVLNDTKYVFIFTYICFNFLCHQDTRHQFFSIISDLQEVHGCDHQMVCCCTDGEFEFIVDSQPANFRKSNLLYYLNHRMGEEVKLLWYFSTGYVYKRTQRTRWKI